MSSDIWQIASYASDAVAAMQQAGIISGLGPDRFAPGDISSREQAAQIIYELYKLLQ